MATPKKIVAQALARDTHCFHCGQTDDLQPHHRKGRGMGGSKVLDRVDNIMMVCGLYNGGMESDPRLASAARAWGHKLAQWEDFDKPVFDGVEFRWYVLTASGEKVDLEFLDEPY